MQKVKVENHVLGGGLWGVLWLFTIGFLKLSFWQGVAAMIIWPYYLGDFLRQLLGLEVFIMSV